ncbi:hypothetical protein QOT17_019533 [Balamuthia mandrillaris]
MSEIRRQQQGKEEARKHERTSSRPPSSSLPSSSAAPSTASPGQVSATNGRNSNGTAAGKSSLPKEERRGSRTFANKASSKETSTPTYAAHDQPTERKLRKVSSPRSSLSSKSPKDKETPADYVFKSLLGEFKEQARRKIEEIMAFGIEEASQLAQVFDPVEDPIFHQLVQSLGELSSSHVPVLIRALLNWRSSQHVVAGTLRPLAQKESGSKMSVKEGILLLEERHKLAVDYIFCTVLLSLLITSQPGSLDEAICTQLETLCFEHFKPHEKQSKGLDSEFSKALFANRKEIPELYARILGILSAFRLSHITAILFKDLGTSFSAKNSLVNRQIAAIEGMRFLQFKITTAQGLEQTRSFLSKYFALFKHKSRPLKLALSRTLVAVLRPLLYQPINEEVDYSAWYSFVAERYAESAKKLKSKSTQTWVPLLTVLLCLCHKDVYLQHCRYFTDSLLRLLKDKSKVTALECIQDWTSVYLAKSEESAEIQGKMLLQDITAHVFPSGSWKTPNEEALDIYVDLICVIAQKKLDYAMHSIIYLLLDVKKTDLIPERVIVGLRALLKIAEELSPSDSNPGTEARRNRPPPLLLPYMKTINSYFLAILSTLDKLYDMTLPQPLKQIQETLQKEKVGLQLLRIVLACIPFCLPSKTSATASMNILARYLVHIDKAIREEAQAALYRVMEACSWLRADLVSEVSSFLMTLSDTNPKLIHHVLHKLSQLLHQWLRLKRLSKLRCSLATMPFSTSDDGENKNEGNEPERIEAIDPAIFHQVEANIPIGEISNHVVGNVGSRENKDLGVGSLVSSMDSDDGSHNVSPRESQLAMPGESELQPLRRASENELVASPDIETQLEWRYERPLDFSRIEAVALVFLCSYHANIRVLAIEILRSVRSIAAAVGEDEDEETLPPARVMDIIDETGPDIVYRLRQDFRFRILNKEARSNPIDYKFLEKVWSAELVHDQICWTYCLGALMPLTRNLCPDAVHMAWHMVCSRMNNVKAQDEKSQPDETVRREHLFWWRNYIVFACSTVSHSVFTRDRRDKGDAPTSVSQLFNSILPLIKSDLHKDAVVMALERVNPEVYDTLFEVMRPYEQEYSARRKRKGVDQLRDKISFIYSFVSETMAQGTLIKNENLRQIFLGCIEETRKYLSQPSTESILDDHQSLRYNFCVIVDNVAKELHLAADETFEAKQRRSLFYFLLNWCRGEAMLQDEQTRRQLSNHLSQIKDPEKKKAYQKVVRDQTFVLQHAACSAAASLLLGPCFDEEVVRPDGPVFSWINTLLGQTERKKLHSIARTALEAFLQNSIAHQELLDTCINQCYSRDAYVARGYFLALVELYKSNDMQHPLPVLFNLILLKAGDSSAVIRRNAVQLLQLIAPRSAEENMEYSPLPITSLLDTTFVKCQMELSQRLAHQNIHLVAEMAEEMVFRLPCCDKRGQKQMLSCLVPWIKEMNSPSSSKQTLPPKGSEQSTVVPELDDTLLQNLLLITMQYADDHPVHVQKIWTTLAEEDNNIGIVIDFLLSIGVKKRNPEFISLAKKIIIYFGRTSSQVSVDTLVTELSSLNTEGRKKDQRYGKNAQSGSSPLSSVRGGSMRSDNGSVSRFDALMADCLNYVTPARGHLALIFLAELAFEIKDEFLVHLPVILHQVFLGLDYQQSVVVEHCRMLLLNLVHSLVVQRIESTEEVPEDFPVYEEALELEEFLKSKKGEPETKQFWVNEDVTLRKTHLNSTEELSHLVTCVVSVFQQEDSLVEEWASEALSWAISCPSFHLANRSYQMYQALLPSITQNVTPIGMLESLYRCTTNRTPENISVSLEILITLQAMVDTLDSAKLWLFPQIFWAAVALLHSDFEQEYYQAIKLLTKLIDRFNFADVAVQNVVQSGTPKGWDPPFVGIQPLVTRGLSGNSTDPSLPPTEIACVELLSKFTVMTYSKIFQPEPKRLLTNILGLLPWLCVTVSMKMENEEIFTDLEEARQSRVHRSQQALAILTNLAEASSPHSSKLSKAFLQCKKNWTHQLTLQSFMEELCPAFCDFFFPKYASFTFRFLFGLLEKGPHSHYYQAVLIILRHMLTRVPDLSTAFRPKYMTSWLSVIMRFITANSEHAPAARQVLLQIIKQSDLSVTHIYSNNFTPLGYRPILREFPDQVSQKNNNARVGKALQSVLKSTEQSQRDKSNIISPEFFENFFYTEEDGAEDIEPSERSPQATLAVAAEDKDTADDEIDVTEFQDIFSVFEGGDTSLGTTFTAHTDRTELPGFGNINDFLDNVPSEDLSISPRAEAEVPPTSTIPAPFSGGGTLKSEGGLLDEVFNNMTFSGDLQQRELPSDILSVSRRWRKLAEQRNFPTEAYMFEIFPVAGKLLNLLRDDYRSALTEYAQQLTPGTFTRRVLEQSVLQADVFGQSLFQQPIPEPKHNSVLFSIVCSKYRSLAEANMSFARTFREQRAQLVDALNQQQRLYVEQKVIVEKKKAKLLKEPKKDIGEAALQFCAAVVKLHYQLLMLYQINSSLQALVNGILESGQPPDESYEEKQRKVIEKEIVKNREIATQLKERVASLASDPSAADSGA